MHPDFWLEKWRAGELGFHGASVHDDLVKWASRFLADGPHRVLVPLCGKTLDLGWMASRGHEVVGVELSPIAAEAVFTERDIPYTLRKTDTLRIYEGGRITILCGDLFDVTPEDVGTVDRVWDRAAMVALPPEVRPRYVAQVRRLLGSGLVLLNSFAYDQSVRSGPPFSVPEEEVRGHHAGAHIEILDSRDHVDQIRQAWRDLGIEEWWTTTYLIAHNAD